ncbi:MULTISPECIES: GntR family transcriptional regulator [unclassified Bradyrhizobium]|uniref:GntR family transcriptional regulator n=1 Tax=unclassified Bradyrhizobium TaxID=2631580 RepID=UPI00247A971B|nr:MULTISPECIES: GntR family transcriptional regulator [unclassified Bradyrhizobium]WGR68683.1 GntR family transcriptional regulator [Bradyrhizobium sp. ISRA426]WGR80738.1 GntR family transcriptional regulator [Bradyrhizobium sp. ISRA430]WGR83923.1 GntR family transcriptional regulator [Bradyrhizobium sp. ISRA432]
MHSVGGFSRGTVAARARNAGGSKVDRAYVALKRAIVSGVLAPETPINKNEWCATFDVSRLSITTAINRLAFEGLVIVEPQRGSYVAKIRLEDVRQWMLMRRALEMEVVAVCAADMSADATEALGQNIAYQRAAISSGDLEGFHELDTRFHRQMTESLALARVGEVLDSIRTHLERVRRTLLPEPGRPEGTFREHEAIYRAIAAHAPEQARSEMANHLDRVSRELQAFVAKHPGFFEE